jgi:hypothetical protein
MAIHFVQIPGWPSTTATSPTPIPGLSLEIPAGTGEQALIILNVTQAVATGSTNPGGWFGLSVDGAGLHTGARFNTPPPPPQQTYRVPCTLVAAVPLKLTPQKVEAMWYADVQCSLNIGPASLTVMM